MSRALCQQCQRPAIACICQFISHINNKIPLLVLQHPSEVKQTKGTVALLQRSLRHCQVLVGENFTDHQELKQILAQYQPLLLYPSASAQVLSLTAEQPNKLSVPIAAAKPYLLIILDGTWKKAYRMFMLSTNLAQLPAVCLPAVLASSGQYRIRKVAKKNALSSLEASCFALALLENELTIDKPLANKPQLDYGIYQPLLDKFVQFNQFQLSFRKTTEN